MGGHTTLSNGLLSAGDALKDSHALLHELKGLNIQQVGAREAVLCDKDRLLVPLDVREEFGGLALKGGDKFSTHEVTLQYHLRPRKCSRKGLTPELSRLA